jgi:EAL and modified HD-GYP domain-containing signal transduction protein
MSVAFVARQPIFDRESRLVGYELLYRATAYATDSGSDELGGFGSDALRMTGATLVTSVLGIGLDQLTGSTPAWVNFPRELLLNHDFEVLDPKRCIIELLETVPCDAESLAACAVLRERGFTLALDDFTGGEEYEPILKLAQIVKLSVEEMTDDELRMAVARLKPYRVKLLAEKVERKDRYLLCRQLGFTYFQGYYFSRPEILKRRELPVEMLGVSNLMKVVSDPSAPDREIEAAIRGDPGLSFKLLRIVNSAATGCRGIESILHAVQLVGRESLHRWLALLFVSATPKSSDVDHELVLTSLERGRFCEIIAERTGRESASASFFLVGLLSTFDNVLGVTMEELLRQVCVSPEVARALLREPGPYTECLSLVEAYVNGDWPSVVQSARPMGVLATLPSWYGESSSWARALMAVN